MVMKQTKMFCYSGALLCLLSPHCTQSTSEPKPRPLLDKGVVSLDYIVLSATETVNDQRAEMEARHPMIQWGLKQEMSFIVGSSGLLMK